MIYGIDGIPYTGKDAYFDKSKSANFDIGERSSTDDMFTLPTRNDICLFPYFSKQPTTFAIMVGSYGMSGRGSGKLYLFDTESNKYLMLPMENGSLKKELKNKYNYNYNSSECNIAIGDIGITSYTILTTWGSKLDGITEYNIQDKKIYYKYISSAGVIIESSIDCDSIKELKQGNSNIPYRCN